MSSASGATARAVIVAPEPSMKKSTAENRPTPSATPGHRGERAARVAHELAPRIAMHAGLASPSGVLHGLAVAQAEPPVEPCGEREVVGDDDERRAELALGVQQSADDGIARSRASSAPVGSSARIVRGRWIERARNRDALPLPAGELVRELAGVVGEPEPCQQLGTALVAVPGSPSRRAAARRSRPPSGTAGGCRPGRRARSRRGGCAPDRARAGSRSRGRASETLPAEGRSRPAIRPSSVDLPHPLGPVTARLLPGSISTLTPSTARTTPALVA